MEDDFSLQHIRRDDLQYRGLILYQDPSLPCFSIDAVELANYVRLSPRMRCVDLGSGTGVIPILAAAKTGARFFGIEQNEALNRLARRSASENGQEIEFLSADVSDAPRLLGYEQFDGVTANPPYFTAGTCLDPARSEARHDTGEALDAFVCAASRLLKNGGRFFVIYPADALVKLVTVLTRYKLEPKRLAFCLPDARRMPKRVMIEAKKGAAAGLNEITSVSLPDEAPRRTHDKSARIS